MQGTAEKPAAATGSAKLDNNVCTPGSFISPPAAASTTCSTTSFATVGACLQLDPSPLARQVFSCGSLTASEHNRISEDILGGLFGVFGEGGVHYWCLLCRHRSPGQPATRTSFLGSKREARPVLNTPYNGTHPFFPRCIATEPRAQHSQLPHVPATVNQTHMSVAGVPRGGIVIRQTRADINCINNYHHNPHSSL